MNRVVKTQSGFTIIELMLAMTFVSVLLVAIAMTIIQMSNIYNKGTTLRAVDQAGRSISKDIQTTIAAAPPLDVGQDGSGGVNYRIQIALGGDRNKPDGGRLCTGSYSYIWNTGSGLARTSQVNVYDGSDEQIRLVKVRDTGSLYCNDTSRPIDPSDATELLSAGDRELALQSFRIVPAATDSVTQQTLYQVSMEIGTNDQYALTQTTTINSIDTTCKPPSDDSSNSDFCAVNLFEFTVRAGSRGEST